MWSILENVVLSSSKIFMFDVWHCARGLNLRKDAGYMYKYNIACDQVARIFMSVGSLLRSNIFHLFS